MYKEKTRRMSEYGNIAGNSISLFRENTKDQKTDRRD